MSKILNILAEIKENQVMLWDRIKDLENHIVNVEWKWQTLQQNEIFSYLLSEIQGKEQSFKTDEELQQKMVRAALWYHFFCMN